MLEKMSDFFEARLDGYDAHMMANIASAEELYPFTVSCLPMAEDCRLLDLGCGTGLELEEYLRRNPTARVTGIDLSRGMLEELRRKLGQFELELICGSYFDVPLGEGVFDGAVSVESLHHFTQAEKIPLYAKLRRALKPGACFILTDYFARSEEEERRLFAELKALKAAQGITDNEFYHFDTPLTIAHEQEALRKAGFSTVELLNQWGPTATLRARP